MPAGIKPRPGASSSSAPPSIRARWRGAAAAASAVAALIAGCGFQLQGADALPDALARTYVETSEPRSEFLASLTDALRLRGVQLVATPEDALSILTIIEDTTDQRVMSVTARNVPREYEIFYAVTFALAAGTEQLVAPESMVATRVYAWNEEEVLGKAAEEKILREALADDLARRVLRRIEASRRHPAAVPASG